MIVVYSQDGLRYHSGDELLDGCCDWPLILSLTIKIILNVDHEAMTTYHRFAYDPPNDDVM